MNRLRIQNRAHANTTGLGLLTLLAFSGTLLGGCETPDNRMSWTTLQEMEAEQVLSEPIVVETSQLNVTELQPYTVGPRDVLALTMVGLSAEDLYAEKTITVRVHGDGTIALPMVGKIDVGGRTLAEIEQAVYDAHVPQYVKALAVYAQLTGPESTTVVLSGAVVTPGPVTLPRNERNVLYALARGGLDALSGSTVTVRPINPDDPELAYDLTCINDLRRALSAPPLRSGDMLVVAPAENSVIYTTGLLNAPGPISVPRGGSMSLVRAVSAAGGLLDFLNPEEATLWRRLPNGEQARVRIELDDIMNGESADIALLPGDVLDVPHTGKTRFRQWFAENIVIGPFGVTAVYDPVADYRARIISDRDDDDAIFRRTLLQSLGSGIPNIVIPPVVP